MELLKIINKIGCSIIRGREIKHDLVFNDPIFMQHIRGGKIIGKDKTHNDVVNAGKNYILGSAFHGDTQLASWYIGLIDNAGFTALAATDIMTSHAGWVESVAYSGATRPAWGPGAPSGQSITNATPVSFTMNATKTIYGIFICSDSTLSGTAGTLWATGGFTAPVPTISGDIIKITDTISC